VVCFKNHFKKKIKRVDEFIRLNVLSVVEGCNIPNRAKNLPGEGCKSLKPLESKNFESETYTLKTYKFN